MRRALVLLSGAAALALAGCSSGGSGDPTFAPSPGRSAIEGSGGVAIQPILPVPSGNGASTGGGGGGGGGNSSTSSAKKGDPLVVATKLAAPVGVTLLPDGTALVGERTTGRIVRVQPVAGRPVPTVRTLVGLDTAGDGGLLDLALSPTYVEDNLIYAYITTPTDNRVVTFTLTGPVTPVLTGIPKGRTGNTGRITFDREGMLDVGTGDAGHPSLAADPSSLAGKVLRISDIGRPAAGNPRPSSPVFTTGHHDVDGLSVLPGSSSLVEVEDGANGRPGELNLIAKGAYYGYPATNGSQRAALAELPAGYAGPGGCAVQGPRVYVTSLGGLGLLSAPFTGAGDKLKVGKFTVALKNMYGRLRTVFAAPDGALWLTTSNRDGKGKPVPADERVIRYVPNGGGSDNSPL
ncbi:MAG: PQQ-dependent sugar dehydrogenase [Jatrophihabitans sp.]